MTHMSSISKRYKKQNFGSCDTLEGLHKKSMVEKGGKLRKEL